VSLSLCGNFFFLPPRYQGSKNQKIKEFHEFSRNKDLSIDLTIFAKK
jgi:hypothetical protein